MNRLFGNEIWKITTDAIYRTEGGMYISLAKGDYAPTISRQMEVRDSELLKVISAGNIIHLGFIELMLNRYIVYLPTTNTKKGSKHSLQILDELPNIKMSLYKIIIRDRLEVSPEIEYLLCKTPLS